MKNLRIGFISSKSAFIDKDVWVDVGLGRILNLLKKKYNHITLCVPLVNNRTRFNNCRLDLKKENFIALPFMPSIATGFFKIFSCLKIIREVERMSDVLIVQLPFPTLLALFYARKPRIYHITTNTKKLVQNSYQGIEYFPKKLGAELFDWFQIMLVRAKNARIITNGRELFRHYNVNGRYIVSSTILEKEIMSIKRKRKDKKFRILFVGHLRPEKGIDVLMNAYGRIIKEIPEAELEIIAPENFVDRGIKCDLLKRIKSFPKEKVRIFGYVPFGKELFQHYADADVLVLPSRSEGTPRVLIEARAFGCPVIASNVGGIPDSVENEVDGLLIQRNNANAFAEAIIRLKNDKKLKTRLIKNGIKRVKEFTAEKYVDAILKEVDNILR